MKEREIKLLWGKSGGRCAFERCRTELSEENIVLGEQAHIIARSKVGPRGDNDLDAKAREKYENLILLCSHHHTLIDKNPDKFPVERLLEMKAKHERWVSDRLNSGVAWEVKLAQVQYLNIPRLSILFAIKGHPISPDLDIEVNGELYELGGPPLMGIMVGFTQAINELGATAIELSTIKEVTDQQIGAVVSFDENFRTKNYSNYSGSLTGDIDKDPHIYKKINNLKWVLPIDPKWITTSTAQSDFCSGISRFAGLAMIKSVTEDAIVCTPFVLGIRKNEWSL